MPVTRVLPGLFFCGTHHRRIIIKDYDSENLTYFGDAARNKRAFKDFQCFDELRTPPAGRTILMGKDGMNRTLS